MENDQMITTSFSVDREAWDEFKIRAIRERMTAGDLLNRLIKDYLKTSPPPRQKLDLARGKK